MSIVSIHVFSGISSASEEQYSVSFGKPTDLEGAAESKGHIYVDVSRTKRQKLLGKPLGRTIPILNLEGLCEAQSLSEVTVTLESEGESFPTWRLRNLTLPFI